MMIILDDRYMISLDIEEKVTDGVEDAYSCHCSTYDGQDLPDKFVDGRFVLSIGDIDGLNLSHKHCLLGRLMIKCRP